MNAALIIFLLGMSASPTGSTLNGLERFQYSQLHMGVRVTVTCYAPEQATAEKGCAAAFARFAELEAIMSDYRPDSELMLLCAKAGQGPAPISRDLLVVFDRAQEVARLSNGAFDITCSPIVRLWRESRKTKKMPDPARLAEAMKVVGYQNLVVDVANSTAELKKPGMKLDLGGIAKGYACDQALIELKKNGIGRAMVEAGGDISASDAPPGRLGWKIAVKGAPGGEVLLDNQAIATSGDAFQYVQIGRKRYSHIVDPRTGIGLTHRTQVSVIAANGLTTDSLSKVLSVLGEKESKPFLERYKARAYFTSSPK